MHWLVNDDVIWRLVLCHAHISTLVTHAHAHAHTHTHTLHACFTNASHNTHLSFAILDFCLSNAFGRLSNKHYCVLSNSRLSNATSKRPKLAFFLGKICPPQSQNCQNQILHISKINFYLILEIQSMQISFKSILILVTIRGKTWQAQLGNWQKSEFAHI